MRSISIYSDGACKGNPGPGGWAALLIEGEEKREISGFVEDTTNNRMELMGVIQGLSLLEGEYEVNVYSDSSYVVNAFTKHWLRNWVKNGWKTTTGGDIKNRDLWEQLLQLIIAHKVKFNKVKGHSNVAGNNRCDYLATQEIKKNRNKSANVCSGYASPQEMKELARIQEMEKNKYKISEIFFSFQGEGEYTGYPAIFIRFFGCNLQCNFGGVTEAQKIDKLEDFVVPDKGCDSGYAWMKEMEHLAKEMSVKEIVDEIVRLTPNDRSEIAIVYTGGEPMLKQKAIVEIDTALSVRSEFIDRSVIRIVETNGTIVLKSLENKPFHYSISPKLKSVTNEAKGINYCALRDIIGHASVIPGVSCILKFVMDDRDESWEELESVVSELEETFGNLRNFIYIMPIGADYAHQTNDEVERIVLRGLNNGYKISLRTHIYVFKNKIGS